MSDIILAQAKAFLTERIRAAHNLAVNDVASFLRATRAAGTDHAFDCQILAEALVYDFAKTRGRPLQAPSGSITPGPCMSTEDIAAALARQASRAALASLTPNPQGKEL